MTVLKCGYLENRRRTQGGVTVKNYEKTRNRIVVLLLLPFILYHIVFGVDAQQTQEDILKINDEGKRYLYGSRYQCQLVFRDPSEEMRIYWNAPEILNLCCDEERGTRAVAAFCVNGITAFCADGSRYRRMNLEDSVGFSSDAGARLRAVILHSFPNRTVDEIMDAVNCHLGEGCVRLLTQGEVLTATQQAIWTIGMGDACSIDRNYVSIRGSSQYDLSEFVYPESITDCRESEFTWMNIENVYRYLLELEPVAPMVPVVTSEAVQNLKCTSQEDNDGTHTVTVSYDLDPEIPGEDDLTVTVICGDQRHSRKYRKGSGSCVFTGITDPTYVTISITGYQTCGDVYWFAPEEDDMTPLIGYDRGEISVNVHLRADVTEYKSAMVESEPTEIKPDDRRGISEQPTQMEKTDDIMGVLFQIAGSGFVAAAIVIVLASFIRTEKYRRMYE